MSRRWPFAITAGGVFLVTLGLVLGGCGRRGGSARSARQVDAQQSEAALTEAAGRLKLGVARSRPETPDLPGWGTWTAPEVVRAGNQLLLDAPLSDEGGGLFLGWGKDDLGTPIAAATVTFKPEERSVLGDRLKPARVNATREGGRFYFSFQESLGVPLEKVDPADRIWFELNLVLADGRTLSVDVGVSLRVSLPKSLVAERQRVGESKRDLRRPAWSKGEGLSVEEDRIVNPSRRRMRVWFRSQGKVQVRTLLAKSVHFTRPSRNTRAVDVRSELLEALSNAMELHPQVTGSGGAPLEMRDEHEGWQSVSLAPGSELRIAWLARPEGGSGLCGMPPSIPGGESWVVCTHSPGHRGEPSDSECSIAQANWEDSFSVVGYRVQKDWGEQRVALQVVIADPLVTSSEVESGTSPYARWVDGGSLLDAIYGQDGRGGSDLSCAGIY